MLRQAIVDRLLGMLHYKSAAIKSGGQTLHSLNCLRIIYLYVYVYIYMYTIFKQMLKQISNVCL